MGDIISNMWMYDNNVNPNIPYLFNTEIFEYDMKEGGFSLIREFKQLPKNKIDYLNSISTKNERKVQIGNYQREDPAFKKLHTESFATARKMFFIANDIKDDNQVIAIKKDAIMMNRRCRETKVGDYINFREKNKYTSYIRLSDKLEFYYNPHQLDIKGLSDDLYEKHQNGMIKFFNTFFKKMETDDEIHTIDFLRNFITDYKLYNLDLDYYRTFDYRSCFITKKGDIFDEYWDEDKNDLDINYNFNIITKLCKVLI